MIIGNKKDQDKLISYTEAQEYAESMKWPLFECSALKGDNVEEAFHQVLDEVMLCYSLANDLPCDSIADTDKFLDELNTQKNSSVLR